MIRSTLRNPLALMLAVGCLCAAGSSFAAENEYLPTIKDKAQDHFRSGLASALRPLPRCNPYRMLKNGECCAPGFVSLNFCLSPCT